VLRDGGDGMTEWKRGEKKRRRKKGQWSTSDAIMMNKTRVSTSKEVVKADFGLFLPSVVRTYWSHSHKLHKLRTTLMATKAKGTNAPMHQSPDRAGRGGISGWTRVASTWYHSIDRCGAPRS
jgi:hypothetical protein